MSRASRVFWGIVVAQALFLVAWAGYHEWVRRAADVILVKGQPVDPRDLMRGDYMTMNYSISSVTLTAPGGTAKSDHRVGDEVWVLLEKRGDYYEVAQASRTRLVPGPAQKLVRGTISYDVFGRSGATRVHYGIEKFFVPEGKGTPSFKLMEVELSVSPAHRLYIKRVLLDGRAYP